MGAIVTQVKLVNPFDKTKHIEFSALVDTGATYLVLPSAWRSRLGELDDVREIEAQVADQRKVNAQIWGPVRIEIENFPAAYTEVMFLDMGDDENGYEPLLGHLPLQQSNLGIDMLNHRLFRMKYVSCK